MLLLAAQAPTFIHMNVDGVDRTLQIYAPNGSDPNPPVIFCYHTMGGSSGFAERIYHIERSWPEAVVVYPDGLPVIAQGSNAPGWSTQVSQTNRDVRFFDAIYAKVMADYHADKGRVFAMGHDNGGSFVYTLWSLRGKWITGFGVSQAVGGQGIYLMPRPCFMTMSEADEVLDFEAQQRSLGAVQQANGTSRMGTQSGMNGMLYSGTAPLMVWTYQGNHTFPGNCVPAMVQFFKGAPGE